MLSAKLYCGAENKFLAASTTFENIDLLTFILVMKLFLQSTLQTLTCDKIYGFNVE